MCQFFPSDLDTYDKETRGAARETKSIYEKKDLVCSLTDVLIKWLLQKNGLKFEIHSESKKSRASLYGVA